MKTWRVGWLCGVLLLAFSCTRQGENVMPWSPTATLTPTSSPVPAPPTTPTSTPTPPSTPTPTPLPPVLLGAAKQAYDYGDWDVASAAYVRLLSYPDATEDEIVQATLGLALTYAASGVHTASIGLLDGFLAVPVAVATPTDTLSLVAADAHLLLADALRVTGSPIEAAEHYSAALQVRPLLAPYVHDWRGDALLAAGDRVAAAQAYDLAWAEAGTASRQVWLLEKIAAARAADGDFDGALEAYDRILSIAVIPAYRARIIFQAADAALARGDTADAYARWHGLIAAHPTEAQAHPALVRLVEAGQPVDDMLRGQINLEAKAYGQAVQAFSRVILGDPDHMGEPHYYAGLAHLRAGSPDVALEEFQVLVETHPDDPRVPDAWMGRALALIALGRLDAAVEAYDAGLARYPELERAPDPVWEVLRRFESAGDLSSAAGMLVDAADRYPNDEGAPEARFRAGLLYYRAGDQGSARVAWEALTQWYPFDVQTQAAWYWIGKVHLSAGATLSATEALSSAVALGPEAFYGLRAGDLLDEEGLHAQSLRSAPFHVYPGEPADCATSEAQAEAESWLRAWLALSPELSVGALPEALLEDARLRRGTLLLRLGHFDEGRTELEALRVAMAGDPLAQYQLALYFRDIGLYRSSIISAAALWRMSPAGSLVDLPSYIGCLVYPTYYSGLVEPEALGSDLSPLFAYALLWQESLFEGGATSFAAAHGLMQVIPPTGAAIAEALDWPPDYETPDLYRPMVSVKFGIWYLAQQRDLFDGDLFAALAAYNAGPGSAMRWMAAAEGDTDLFVEMIDYEETRRYVRLIREHYEGYRRLYARPMSTMTPVSILRGSD